MSIQAGSIVGYDRTPTMNLRYGGTIRRMFGTYDAMGGAGKYNFQNLPGVYPMDVAPMSDNIVTQQSGQQSTLTHVLHFEAGTDVRDRDEIKIEYAPQPGNFGNVGDTYLIMEVLEPSSDLNYMRCRAMRGKLPEK